MELYLHPSYIVKHMVGLSYGDQAWKRNLEAGDIVIRLQNFIRIKYVYRFSAALQDIPTVVFLNNSMQM